MKNQPDVLCQAKYQYGNLTYAVTITKDDHDMDWEHDKVIHGEFFFVNYEEKTLPNKKQVGGFKTLEDAMKWVKDQFGELEWEYL